MAEKFDVEIKPSSVDADITTRGTVILSGVGDYNDLDNKPQINSVVLIGNKSLSELGHESMTAIDILNIITRE